MPTTNETTKALPVVSQTISAKIFRYNPELDSAPRFEEIQVLHEKHMRVLDVLDQAVEKLGIDVGYRFFCGVKRCGLCAVSVNGKASLACWEKAEPGMVIEPLAKLPVIRDLVVDRTGLEATTIDLNPCLVREKEYEGFPEQLTHQSFADSFPLMNCIECYVCTASCPAVPDISEGGHGASDFAGPGALVQLAKVALHPSAAPDRAADIERADIEACMSCGRCEEVCPNSIPIVSGAILPLKGLVARSSGHRAPYANLFAENVRTNGNVNSAFLFVRMKGISGVLRSLPMLLKMLLNGKTNVHGKVNRAARCEISRLFNSAKQVGQ